VQFVWLLAWQEQNFQDALSEAQKPHFDAFLGPLVSENFLAQPSSGPAFVQLAAQSFDAHTQNAKRLLELKALDVPVKLIWGQFDPYITVTVAERRKSQLKHPSLTVVPTGHWLQIDEPQQVATAMLPEVWTTAGKSDGRLGARSTQRLTYQLRLTLEPECLKNPANHHQEGSQEMERIARDTQAVCGFK
jgi:hypothetical protein